MTREAIIDANLADAVLGMKTSTGVSRLSESKCVVSELLTESQRRYDTKDANSD